MIKLLLNIIKKKKILDNISDTIILDESILDESILDESILDENISDKNISDESILDKNISDKNISDESILDKNISDKNISDENISDKNISDENISDENISDENISDENISDENISDENISDENIFLSTKKMSNKQFEINIENKLVKYWNTNIINKDTNIINKDTNIINKDTTIINKDTTIINKDTTIINKDTNIINKDTNIINKDTNIINKYTTIINKESFRVACLEQLNLIKNIEIPNILYNQINETVLIEFRWFNHLEFLIRNMILKLPLWSHTIVCGNINYESIKICCNNISNNIKIIKLDIDNLCPSTYSSLLYCKTFWNQFYGEKILIYQEDSYLFHTKNIDQFLVYDYVGAPWPINQDDNLYGVGNGGFSLRTKSKMIEVIEKVKIEDLVINKSTLNYMKNTNSFVLPEDVYFSKSLIDYNIGKVANRDIASQFSQETLQSENPLGGHNFFLAKDNTLNIGLIKKINKIGVLSHYNFNMGGGEKYLSEIIKYFIDIQYNIIFFNNTPIKIIKNTFKIFNIDINLIIIKKIDELKMLVKLSNKIQFDYFIEMSNSIIPSIVNKIAHKHIFHCQFPENYLQFDNTYISAKTKHIDHVIVNSEYTYLYLEPAYKNKLKILYPLCIITKLPKQPVVAVSNSFITIGRLFRYVKNSNCKNIDKIINVFTKLNQFDYTLNIVCSIKDYKYFKYLQSTIRSEIQCNKIKFYPDCSDAVKESLLLSSKYYIHAAGILNPKGQYPSEEEHFGISPIEGIYHNCIPICADRGYPPYYIKNNKNGYLFDNEFELYNIIFKILNNMETPLIENTFKCIDKFIDKKIYTNTFTKILFNC